MHLFSLFLHKANNQLTMHFLYSVLQYLIYKSYLSLNEFYTVQKYMLQYFSSCSFHITKHFDYKHDTNTGIVVHKCISQVLDL